jgi:chromosomal replication initiator protein
MEWGLVAHVSVPELETRVAILQYKAQQKGLQISSKVAFFIAEHICHNVRQLEGAINRLCAQSRLLGMALTEEYVEKALQELMQHTPGPKISVEQIFKSVSSVFEVRISELKSESRTKNIVLPRQVAMYLACKLIKESLEILAAHFGRKHSTLIHACKNIEKMLGSDDALRKKISMAEKNVHV